MTRYARLIEEYALGAGLRSADLMASQELVIADVSIGLAPEGDQDSGDIIFFTTLGKPSPAVDLSKLMQLMLEANALWVGTGGCTLGLQAGTGAVLLCARLSLVATDARALSSALQAFTDVALLWRDVVRGKVMPELPVQAANH